MNINLESETMKYNDEFLKRAEYREGTTGETVRVNAPLLDLWEKFFQRQRLVGRAQQSIPFNYCSCTGSQRRN